MCIYIYIWTGKVVIYWNVLENIGPEFDTDRMEMTQIVWNKGWIVSWFQLGQS